MKSNHRFHVIKKLKNYVKKSKVRSKRGKYRAATTTLGDTTLTEVLWNDSSLVGCVSADLGSETRMITRRMGRHKPSIACPNMMVVRSEHFRAVDQNDQLRMGKWGFQYTCKYKAWLKLFFALIELLMINIYILSLKTEPDLLQDEFRWALITQLVRKSKWLEEGEIARRTRARRRQVVAAGKRVTHVPRWEGGAEAHHLHHIPDYVSPDVVN